MKRVIFMLGLGWVFIYALNHVFLPPVLRSDQVSDPGQRAAVDRHIDSWGPYLPDERAPIPNRQDETVIPQPKQPSVSAASAGNATPQSNQNPTAEGAGRKAEQETREAALEPIEPPVVKTPAQLLSQRKKEARPSTTKKRQPREASSSPRPSRGSREAWSPPSHDRWAWSPPPAWPPPPPRRASRWPAPYRGPGMFMLAPPGF
jgi:hypothetical protein